MAQRRSASRRNGVWGRSFDDSDLDWLARKFEEENRNAPDVTLEEFALRFGIDPELVRRFVVQGVIITLWHGTTTQRAIAILREGFQAPEGKQKRRKIWFTLKPKEAHWMARRRARQRQEEPVVFCCEVSLGLYPEFDRPKPDHYAFRHSHVAADVIRSIDGLKRADAAARSGLQDDKPLDPGMQT